MSAIDQQTMRNISEVIQKLSSGEYKGFGALLIGFDADDDAIIFVLANGRFNLERATSAFAQGTLELLTRISGHGEVVKQ